MVQLGESVGILAAQSIGEPGTQLTMRTFHTGGIFSGESSKTLLSPSDGIIFFKKDLTIKKIYTKYGEKAFFLGSKKNLYLINEKGDKFSIFVPENTILFVCPGQNVYFKQVLAQVCTYNFKFLEDSYFVKAKFSGQIFLFNNLLWILSNNVFNSFTFYLGLVGFVELLKETMLKDKFIFKRNKNFKSCIKLNYCCLKKVSFFNLKKLYLDFCVLEAFLEKSHFFSISKRKTSKFVLLNKGDLKVGDFLLENEFLRTKITNKFSNLVIQKEKSLFLLRKASPFFVPVNSVLLKKNLSFIKRDCNLFSVTYKKKKTEDIVQGLPRVEELLEAKKQTNIDDFYRNPHNKLKRKFYSLKDNYSNDLAVRKSFDFIQKFLVKQTLGVYNSQGVDISYKHMEVIIKKMTSKVIVTDSADSYFIAGEIVDFNKIQRLKDKFSLTVKYEPILIGISKLSLMSQSFISQASFQETTRVLSRSAIEGKVDWLYGLKENLILGNVIPAGTGFNVVKVSI